MNETLINATVQTSELQASEETKELRELLTVELAYVGGGMANFSFA